MMSRKKDHPCSILYVPHGGGPMPLLGDPGHAALTQFLRDLPSRLPRPDAILVISAHWEESVVTLTAGESPGIIYDYGGFPPESYTITYPAPGQPELAEEIAGLLRARSIPARLDARRGFDHGMFVPLKLMYPEADIPCIQLSLLHNLNAGAHLEMGRALSSLRDRNILVLGSGMSFHNLRAFFMPGLVDDGTVMTFDAWLRETCAGESLTGGERERRLLHWDQAPGALACHPRPEHLLPLHVCYGMTGGEAAAAEVIFNAPVMGRVVSGFLWQ